MAMRSPGSRASPGSCAQRPWRYTCSACFGTVSVRSSRRLRSRCPTTVHSNITSMPSVNSE